MNSATIAHNSLMLTQASNSLNGGTEPADNLNTYYFCFLSNYDNSPLSTQNNTSEIVCYPHPFQNKCYFQ